MEEDKRSALEEQLKKMIENSSQEKDKKEKPKTKTGTGNVIRRRAGEKEKRFSKANITRIEVFSSANCKLHKKMALQLVFPYSVYNYQQTYACLLTNYLAFCCCYIDDGISLRLYLEVELSRPSSDVSSHFFCKLF